MENWTTRTAHESVIQDFRRARLRATIERVLAQLTGKSAELLCYDEVRDLLKVTGSRKRRPADHPRVGHRGQRRPLLRVHARLYAP